MMNNIMNWAAMARQNNPALSMPQAAPIGAASSPVWQGNQLSMPQGLGGLLGAQAPGLAMAPSNFPLQLGGAGAFPGGGRANRMFGGEGGSGGAGFSKGGGGGGALWDIPMNYQVR